MEVSMFAAPGERTIIAYSEAMVAARAIVRQNG